MSSKLRRTPLFGYDGNLGIPIIPPPSSSKQSNSSHTSTPAKFGFDYSKSKVRLCPKYCTNNFLMQNCNLENIATVELRWMLF